MYHCVGRWTVQPFCSIQNTQGKDKIYFNLGTGKIKCTKIGSHVGADNRRVWQLKWFSEDLEIISELGWWPERSYKSVCVASETLEGRFFEYSCLQSVWELQVDKLLLLFWIPLCSIKQDAVPILQSKGDCTELHYFSSGNNLKDVENWATLGQKELALLDNIIWHNIAT